MSREAGLDSGDLSANRLIIQHSLFHLLDCMENAGVITPPKKHSNILESYSEIFIEDKHSYVSSMNQVFRTTWTLEAVCRDMEVGREDFDDVSRFYPLGGELRRLGFAKNPLD